MQVARFRKASGPVRRQSHAGQSPAGPAQGATAALRRAVRSCLEPLEKRTFLSAVTVTPVNDLPTSDLTTSGLPDVAVNEDAPDTLVDLWAAFSDEDPDNQLTYTVVGNTNPALFSSVTVDAATGKLVLNYAANVSGAADITVRATDTGSGAAQESLDDTFAVTVAPVNDAPSFTKGPDQSVQEDAGPQSVPNWATAISAGPANEAGQQLTFDVTNDNPALFAAAPAVSPDGTLTYTPAAEASGTAVVTVTLRDNGGTANGGDDTSDPQTFNITVGAVNDDPTFASIADRVIRLNAPPQVVTITGVSPGPGAESTQGLTFTATSSNTAFIPNPTITGTGSTRRLTLEPRAGVAGSTVITVTARDAEGATLTRTFRVRVGAEAEPPAADPTEFRVNTNTEGAQRALAGAGRSVATDAAGNFVVTWMSFDQETAQQPFDDGWGVFAQRYNRDGVAQGGEIHVNQTTTDFQQFPTVAAAPDGSFVIAWQGLQSGTDGSNIFARRYGPDGLPRGNEFQVNSVAAGEQSSPSVGLEADGDFVIAFASRGTDGTGDNVYARRFDSAGVARGAEFQVNTHTANDQNFPSVAVNDAGKFLVAWQSGLQDGSETGVYARQYTADGVAEGGEVRVNVTTAGGQQLPAAAPSGSGWVVTWTSSPLGSATEADVFVRRLVLGDPAEGVETLVNTTATGFQLRSSVASDADGDFVVAWEGFAGGSWNAYAQRYDAQATALGEEFTVHTVNSPEQQNAGVAMDPAGNFVVAWTSLGQDGSSFGVYARRFRANTVPAVAVIGSEFVYQAVPHRLRLSFSKDVSGTLGTPDLTVRNVTTNQTVTFANYAYDPSTNTATFTFDGAAPNGNYVATLNAAGVADEDGRPMASDYSFEFYSLSGDVNRDRAVNGTDFAILAGNFGKTGMTFPQGDANGDGTINGTDFAILAGNFGRTVPPPPPPAAVVAAASTPTPALAAPAPAPAPATATAPVARRPAVKRAPATPKKVVAPRRVVPVARAKPARPTR